MARGVQWPLRTSPNGGFALTDAADPGQCTTQELASGLLSERSANPWSHPRTGIDSDPITYATTRDGGRARALTRVQTVFAEKELHHRARLDGPPEIVRRGPGWQITARYRSIEDGGDRRTLTV